MDSVPEVSTMNGYSAFVQAYKDKKILIFGLGIQGGGIESAIAFAKIGAEIRVTDLKSKDQLQKALEKLAPYPSISYSLGEHREADIMWADVVVQNPGVKTSNPFLKLAHSLNKEVTMEIALFMKYTLAQTIGITGTRGKSTTTQLIFESLRSVHPDHTYLAGNVPDHAAIQLLETLTPEDTVVLELSSYQLHSFENYQISPHIAVFTNFFPDHLNYYSSMSEYLSDKLNICRYQRKGDVTVTTEQITATPEIKKDLPATTIIAHRSDFPIKLLYLFGDHNYENAAVALAVLVTCGMPKETAAKAISQVHGLPFRQQYLGTLKGTAVYNDSTSTTPTAGIIALRTFSHEFPEKKLTVIIGGNSKNLPVEDFIHEINSKAEQVFFLKGTFTDEIYDKVKTPKVHQKIYDSLNELMTELVDTLSTDQVVVFSPAATSFATFRNEFDRGEQFSAAFVAAQTKYGN